MKIAALAVVTVAIVIAFFVGASTHSVAAPEAAIVTQWEYKVVIAQDIVRAAGETAQTKHLDPKFIEHALNEQFGKQGWELADVGRNDLQYIFKRPLAAK